jgi:hypothetical protein
MCVTYVYVHVHDALALRARSQALPRRVAREQNAFQFFKVKKKNVCSTPYMAVLSLKMAKYHHIWIVLKYH